MQDGRERYECEIECKPVSSKRAIKWQLPGGAEGIS